MLHCAADRLSGKLKQCRESGHDLREHLHSTQHCPYLPASLYFQRRKLGSERGSDSKSQEPQFALSDFDLSVFPHWHSPSSSCPAASQPLPPCLHTCLASCLLPSIPLLSVFFFWLCWVFVAACGLSLGAMPRFLIAVTSVVAEHRTQGLKPSVVAAQGL